MEIGRSELNPDPPEYGSEANAVQKPDQIDASFLWGGDSRTEGDGPLVATFYQMNRGDSDGTSQRGHVSSDTCGRTLPHARDHRQTEPRHPGPSPDSPV